MMNCTRNQAYFIYKSIFDCTAGYRMKRSKLQTSCLARQEKSKQLINLLQETRKFYSQICDNEFVNKFTYNENNTVPSGEASKLISKLKETFHEKVTTCTNCQHNMTCAAYQGGNLLITSKEELELE